MEADNDDCPDVEDTMQYRLNDDNDLYMQFEDILTHGRSYFGLTEIKPSELVNRSQWKES